MEIGSKFMENPFVIVVSGSTSGIFVTVAEKSWVYYYHY